MDRLYERENVEVEMCRLCFTLALSQQAITNSPYAQEFNNFKFIELQIGFELPANICGQCLVQLNQLGSYLKMCKDAYNTYKLMKPSPQKPPPNPELTSDIKQEAVESESEEIFETSIDIADESEKLFAKFSEEDPFFETITQPQIAKVEIDCDDTSSDPFYCEDTNMEEMMNKETSSQTRTCPTCGVNVTTLASHYSKNPKCGPRNSHCPTCNLYFGNKHRLLHHQKTHHPEEVSTTSLMCHICLKAFQYADSLSQHLQTHENDQQDGCDQSGNDTPSDSDSVETISKSSRDGSHFFDNFPVESSMTNINEPMEEVNIKKDVATENGSLQSPVSTTASTSKPFDINELGVFRRRKLRKHRCFYCSQEIGHYSRHLERKHSDEFEVQMFMALEKKSKKRKSIIAKLRREGDFSSANVVPVKTLRGNATKNNYSCCQFCRGYYLSWCLRRHMKICFFKPEAIETHRNLEEMKGDDEDNDNIPLNELVKHENNLEVDNEDNGSILLNKRLKQKKRKVKEEEVGEQSADTSIQKKTRIQRIPWTDNQKKLTEFFFQLHIKEKIVPRKEEVMQLIRKYPGIFHNKPYPTIKTYVYNKFR